MRIRRQSPGSFDTSGVSGVEVCGGLACSTRPRVPSAATHLIRRIQHGGAPRELDAALQGLGVGFVVSQGSGCENEMPGKPIAPHPAPFSQFPLLEDVPRLQRLRASATGEHAIGPEQAAAAEHWGCAKRAVRHRVGYGAVPGTTRGRNPGAH